MSRRELFLSLPPLDAAFEAAAVTTSGELEISDDDDVDEDLGCLVAQPLTAAAASFRCCLLSPRSFSSA